MIASQSAARLRHLVNARTGRSFVVPMDHGISIGAVPGLYDMRDSVQQMAGTGVNCVVVHKGIVRSINEVLQSAPDIGLIVHMAASTAHAPDPNAKHLVCTVQEALALGADGVSVHVNIGAETEGQMLRDFAEVAEQCHDLNIPLLAMIYARGPKLQVQFSEAFNIHCARIAYEIGADLVKVQYTGSPESFSRVVEAARIPVLIAGGPRMATDEDVLRTVSEALEGGASGISMGRNVFGADNVRTLCTALAGIIHEGHSLDQALDALNSASSVTTASR